MPSSPSDIEAALSREAHAHLNARQQIGSVRSARHLLEHPGLNPATLRREFLLECIDEMTETMAAVLAVVRARRGLMELVADHPLGDNGRELAGFLAAFDAAREGLWAGNIGSTPGMLRSMVVAGGSSGSIVDNLRLALRTLDGKASYWVEHERADYVDLARQVPGVASPAGADLTLEDGYLLTGWALMQGRYAQRRALQAREKFVAIAGALGLLDPGGLAATLSAGMAAAVVEQGSAILRDCSFSVVTLSVGADVVASSIADLTPAHRARAIQYAQLLRKAHTEQVAEADRYLLVEHRLFSMPPASTVAPGMFVTIAMLPMLIEQRLEAVAGFERDYTGALFESAQQQR